MAGHIPILELFSKEKDEQIFRNNQLKIVMYMIRSDLGEENWNNQLQLSPISIPGRTEFSPKIGQKARNTQVWANIWTDTEQGVLCTGLCTGTVFGQYRMEFKNIG